jgi:hypothetical protein
LRMSVEPALFCEREMTVRKMRKQRDSLVFRRMDRVMESPAS